MPGGGGPGGEGGFTGGAGAAAAAALALGASPFLFPCFLFLGPAPFALPSFPLLSGPTASPPFRAALPLCAASTGARRSPTELFLLLLPDPAPSGVHSFFSPVGASLRSRRCSGSLALLKCPAASVGLPGECPAGRVRTLLGTPAGEPCAAEGGAPCGAPCGGPGGSGAGLAPRLSSEGTGGSDVSASFSADPHSPGAPLDDSRSARGVGEDGRGSPSAAFSPSPAALVAHAGGGPGGSGGGPGGGPPGLPGPCPSNSLGGPCPSNDLRRSWWYPSSYPCLRSYLSILGSLG